MRAVTLGLLILVGTAPATAQPTEEKAGVSELSKVDLFFGGGVVLKEPPQYPTWDFGLNWWVGRSFGLGVRQSVFDSYGRTHLTLGSIRFRHKVLPKAQLHLGWDVFWNRIDVRADGRTRSRSQAGPYPVFDVHLSADVRPRWDFMVGMTFTIGEGTFVHPTALLDFSP